MLCVYTSTTAYTAACCIDSWITKRIALFPPVVCHFCCVCGRCATVNLFMVIHLVQSLAASAGCYYGASALMLSRPSSAVSFTNNRSGLYCAQKKMTVVRSSTGPGEMPKLEYPHPNLHPNPITLTLLSVAPMVWWKVPVCATRTVELESGQWCAVFHDLTLLDFLAVFPHFR